MNIFNSQKLLLFIKPSVIFLILFQPLASYSITHSKHCSGDATFLTYDVSITSGETCNINIKSAIGGVVQPEENIPLTDSYHYELTDPAGVKATIKVTCPSEMDTSHVCGVVTGTSSIQPTATPSTSTVTSPTPSPVASSTPAPTSSPTSSPTPTPTTPLSPTPTATPVITTPVATTSLLDTDGDGVYDTHDPDDDNDGIPDLVELKLRIKTVDSDDDGQVDDNVSEIVVVGWFHNFPEHTLSQDGYGNSFGPDPGFDGIRAGSGGTWGTNSRPEINIPSTLPPGADPEYINITPAARGYSNSGSGINTDTTITTLDPQDWLGAFNINSGINASSYSQALSNNDYIEKTFTTADSFPDEGIVHLSAMTATDLGFNQSNVQIAVAVSDDSFSTYSILLQDYTFRRNDETRLIPFQTKFTLQPQTQYSVRIYFYNLSNQTELVFDNIQFAINHYEQRDSDSDGIPNDKDLDSDNDGLNDVNEAGHLEDANFDGMADGLDLDQNGMIDAAAFDPKDQDDDGAPDYRDVDSDDRYEILVGNGSGDDIEKAELTEVQNPSSSQGTPTPTPTPTPPTSGDDDDDDSQSPAFQAPAASSLAPTASSSSGSPIITILSASVVDADGDGMIDSLIDIDRDGIMSAADGDLDRFGDAEMVTTSADHFEFTAPLTNASTCAQSEIQIIACADAATPCTPLTNYQGIVELSTTSLHGNWLVNPSQIPNGTLTDNSVDDGLIRYEFDVADQGQLSLFFSNSHADDLLFIATEQTGPASGVSIPIAFRDNAFVFDTSMIGRMPSGQTVSVDAQLWKNDGSACGIATEYNGNVGIKAWIELSLASPTGASASINGVILPRAEPASNNVTLNFIQGITNLALTNLDVGQYTLHIKDDSSSFAHHHATGIKSLLGQSNLLTSPPFGFDINVQNDSQVAASYAVDHNSSAFRRAGEDVNLTIRAVAWQAEDDTNLDGYPDAGANLQDNTSLLSFGSEMPAETLSVTHTLLEPSTGVAGVLTGGSSIGGFASGERDVLIQFSEVGIINLNAQLSDGDYLGAGNASGSLLNLGRFVPAYFQYISSSVNEACYNPVPFTYLSQDFGVQFAFEAVNMNLQRTQNYFGNFGKLAPSSSASFNIRAHQQSPYENLSSRLVENAWTGLMSFGEINVSANYRLDRFTSPNGPYITNISSAPIDSDGVSLNVYNIDTDNDTSLDRVFLGLSDQRYGRAVLENGSGSELSAISLGIRTEYYGQLGSNNGFILFDEDCSNLFSSSINLTSFTENLNAGETTAGVTSWSNGSGVLELSAPGDGNHGSVTAQLDVPNWLEFDFDGLGTDEDPSAVGSFGIYSGKSHIIIKKQH